MAISENELWRRIRGLEGKTVYTCTRRNPNKILRVTDNRVEIEGKSPVSFNGERGIFANYDRLIKDCYLIGGSGKDESIGRTKANLAGRYVIMPILQRAVPEEIECIPLSERLS